MSTVLLNIVIFLLVCVAIYVAYNYFTGAFQLKCIVSRVDGNVYCVRETAKLQQSADLLAKVTEKCRKLVVFVKNKYKGKDNEFVEQLVKNFNPQKIMEALPTSEYTSYSENKGEKIAFCLNTEKGGNTLIDEHTLTFVAIHELTHVGTKSFGHKSDFWQNFKFMLGEAKEAGIHEPRDYKKKPQKYCGMTIRDNPAFDL